mgnify:FL=1
MGYIGDGPKPELEVGDISTKDVTATGDLTVDTNTLFVDASENKVGVGTTTVTDAGVAITPSVTRAGDWDAKLALQSTAGSDFPALLFSGADTTQYGGIISTTDTSGNTVNNVSARIDFRMPSSTTGAIGFKVNPTVGSGSPNEAMLLTSQGDILQNTATRTSISVDWTPDANPVIEAKGNGTYGGLLHLNNEQNTNGGGLSSVVFGNTANSGASAATGRVCAGLLAKCVTSDSNAGDDAGADLRFFTKPESGALTERMRVLSDGGLTFNGDSAQANALDDYEEGSWTPVVAAGWTSVTFPNSYQFGKYQKVGNVVEAFFFLQFSGTNAGAHVQITGLPFTSVNETAGALRGGALTYFTIPVDSAGMVMPYVFQNATEFRLYAGDDGGASTLSNGNASNAFLIGSVRYRVS